MNNSTSTNVLGVDIGGSHITAALVDLKISAVIPATFIRKRVDRNATADVILGTWAGAILEIANKFPDSFDQIGIAMPGPFNYKEGISLITGFDKYEALYLVNIREELAKRLSMAPSAICFRNDAEAYLAGELIGGAAKGFNRAIGITLGTGLGSSYSYDGITADAELSVLPYKGEKIEEFVSTRGIVRAYYELSGERVDDARAVTDQYDSNPLARQAMQVFADDFSWFLEQFVHKHQPEVIVIGGNIANAWNQFIPQTLQNLQALLQNIQIVPSALGEDAMLIGGASCHLNKSAS
ncbi:glucokinase [bacterium A37T11]|nr:glucokinase [bacterium A37T11]